MRKTFKRFYRAAFYMVIIISLLTACDKSSEKAANSQNYITAKNTQLPENVISASELVVQGDSAYICVRKDNKSTGKPASYIAKVGLDGGDFQQLTEDLEDLYELRDFVIDENNNIWAVAEKFSESFYLLRFNDSGTLEQSISLSSVMENDIPVNSETNIFINADSEGSLYVTVGYAAANIYVFDKLGEIQFSVKGSGQPQALTLAEGEVAICDSVYGGGLVSIDAQKQDWSADTVAVETVTGAYGGKSHSFYVFDSSKLYGYDIKTGESELIFNWSDLGLSTGDAHLTELEDGRFAVLNGSQSQSGDYSYDLTILKQGSDERTVLTMVSLSASPIIVQAVSDFNKNSEEYRIELTEYYPFKQNVSDEEWSNAITNLNTAIISGDIPDIIDLSELPVDTYYNKGIIEDMYPYLEKDPDINRNDYFENVFDAISINNKLPYITNGVSVRTMISNSSIIGEGAAWSYDEIKALLEEYGSSSIANLTAEYFLSMVLQTSDRFVNWSIGECYFDSAEFITLLELAGELQLNSESGFGGSSDNSNSSSIATFDNIYTAYQIAQLNNAYEGNLNIVGLPSDEEVFNAISPETMVGISSSSENKDGAWSFAKTLLQEKQQKSCLLLPIHKESFDTVMQSTIEGNSTWNSIYGGNVTQVDVDITKEILCSATQAASSNQTLENIVLEEAAKYFSGAKSSQDAASSIQSKATLYMNELR